MPPEIGQPGRVGYPSCEPTKYENRGVEHLCELGYDGSLVSMGPSMVG